MSGKSIRNFATALITGGLLTLASTAQAVVITDGTNTLNFDPANARIDSWVVGVDHVKAATGVQYSARLGANPFASLGALDPTPLNLDGGVDTSLTSWLYSFNEVNVVLTLQIAGGLGGSGLVVDVGLTHTLGTSFVFGLLETNDFDMGGTAAGDTLAGSPIGADQDDGFAKLSQVFGLATGAAIGVAPTYTDNQGADKDYAYQWEYTVAPTGPGGEASHQILKTIVNQPEVTLIPEPATTVLSVLGLLALAGAATRRSA